MVYSSILAVSSTRFLCHILLLVCFLPFFLFVAINDDKKKTRLKAFAYFKPCIDLFPLLLFVVCEFEINRVYTMDFSG